MSLTHSIANSQPSAFSIPHLGKGEYLSGSAWFSATT